MREVISCEGKSAGGSWSKVYRSLVSFLHNLNLPQAEGDAEWILCTLLRVRRTEFWQSLPMQFPPDLWDKLCTIKGRLLQGEPLPYILRRAWFAGQIWYTRPGVLIPRPETEEVVQQTLEVTKNWADTPLQAVDVGTGSGIIATCLAQQRPSWSLWAIDSSSLAVRVAKRNVCARGLQGRVRVCRGHYLQALPTHTTIRLLVANLPYISTSLLPCLPPSVAAYEPVHALDGGLDGLQSYRVLLQEWRDRGPSPPWRMICEISPEQHGAILELFQGNFPSARYTVERDLSGRPRIAMMWQDSCG
ncbi:N5-glutamine methyltransferase family protein [Pasteuria penetrans]|uniref:N5-glutamine methyltransferase family protein n=1 Tax=Pasteuria penetrans TaxID=86005 RepID=UPI000FB1F168|nr:HemK/PrmC family methyltransferase [Pasteuria penetrans]